MESYFNDLEKFQSKNINDREITIKIFDFDGTLFNSPVPNPSLWGSKKIGKLKNELRHGGYGWFQNPITLEDEYIDYDDFIDPVVKEYKKSSEELNTITVLLTGRNILFNQQIRKILNSKGLVFDEYGLKDQPKTTMQFKQDFIRSLISKYGPSRIEIWEDRYKHAKQFQEFLNSLDGIEGLIHNVKSSAKYMPTDLEIEVVEELTKHKQPDSEKPKDIIPTYYGVFLNDQSHNKLLEELKTDIPTGWKTIAHHMTIAFGNIKSDNIKNFIENNMGKEFKLTATEMGKSIEALAVKVESEVPTQNKIPHITVAIPPNGKPVKSNFINNWEKLEIPIILYGKISAKY